MIVSADWRLENAKSPAAMLQENNPHRRQTHEYTAYYTVCTWYLVFAMHTCLSRSLCDYSELSFVARMTNRHGHIDWVCLTVVLAGCRWVEKTQQKHTCGRSDSKETAVSGHVSRTDIHTKNGIVWTAARHRAECHSRTLGKNRN